MTHPINRTRRMFTSGAIAFAVASPGLAAAAANELSSAQPIWPSADAVDAELFELWARRDVAAAEMRAVSEAASTAEALVPDWARSGHVLVNRDGSPEGITCGWPALPAELLMDCDELV